MLVRVREGPHPPLLPASSSGLGCLYSRLFQLSHPSPVAAVNRSTPASHPIQSHHVSITRCQKFSSLVSLLVCIISSTLCLSLDNSTCIHRLSRHQFEHKVYVKPFSDRFPGAKVYSCPGQWSWPINLPPNFPVDGVLCEGDMDVP